MKKIGLLILLFTISSTLVSCVNANSDVKKSNHALFKLDSVVSIVVNNKREGEFTITDREVVERYAKAIHTAEYSSGQLDIAKPDYVAHVHFDGNEDETLLFWINDEHNGLFSISGKDGHYRLTSNAKADLLHMFSAVDQLKVDVEQPNDGEKEVTSLETVMTELIFQTERGQNGDLVAKPLGLEENDYTLTLGSIVELQENWYHTVSISYGSLNTINALVVHNPATDEVHVQWSDKLSSSNNSWHNAFLSSYNMLIPFNENQLLFLESELSEVAGEFHLSSYNATTGAIVRLREDFWPLTDEYDYLYQYDWNADQQTLFMQSYLGHVWFFDLKTGEDIVHILKYPVIPHSTTGAPSLFVSPTHERFVHDDESGKVTFFNQKGTPLQTVDLPLEQLVPSEKIKWNPSGTIAWMDQAGIGNDRTLARDIDYLKLAPEQINFYNPDGLPIGFIQAGSVLDGEALEVVAWMDANVAVIKSYTVEARNPDSVDLEIQDISYFLYDVIADKKGNMTDSIPSGAIIISDNPWQIEVENSHIIATYKDIMYKKPYK